MSRFWGKIKVKVDHVSTSFQGLSIRSDKDKSENDTIISRALLRYYEADVPEWLQDCAMDQDPRSSMSSSSTRPGRLTRTTTGDFSDIYERPAPRASVSSASGRPVASTPSPVPTPAPTSGFGSKLRRAKW